MNLLIFLCLKNPVLNFLNFMSGGAMLSYELLSYKKTCIVRKLGSILTNVYENEKFTICPTSL